MTVNEDQRFRMHLELRRVFGDEVGNTVMEHLPPRGWGDVARTVDVTHVSERLIQTESNLTLRIDQLDATVNARIDHVEAHLSARIDQLDATVNARIDHVEKRLQGIASTLRVMIGSMISISAAMIVMLVQINQSL